ncbi:MAG: hypothetical protein HC828_13190, partial [Blastochloris sp.]|nr:hypothetical protein [Blastochloris sp.]
RAELEAYAAEHGPEALFERLLRHDPDAHAFIDARNVRRVVRALEVCLITGQPFSAQRTKTPPPYRTLVYGLTMKREASLRTRGSSRRCDDGSRFLDEVRALLDRVMIGGCRAMSGLGYAQLAAHLIDGVPLDDAVAATKQATRDFIRRQYTWFRGHDHATVWHDAELLDTEAMTTAIKSWLEGEPDGAAANL